MKKLLVLLIGLMLVMSVSVLAKGNQGKDNGNGWVHYGDVLVYWELADCDGDSEIDGYQYWWGQDRNLNGVVGEGWVEVDYGRFGGVVLRNEGTGYVDFGCDSGIDYFTKKVIHLTETWVPGVTVPGGEDKFIVKDNDGDGVYEGEFTTPLFWDGVTIQGDPPGPYLISDKFEYTFNTDEDGKVIGGSYVQKQYMTIPDY